MKQKMIDEINGLILQKLILRDKREYCIKVKYDKELNMEDSEVIQFVAIKKDGEIKYADKSFFHTMREFQPREQNVKYTYLDINAFSEEELKELLERIRF